MLILTLTLYKLDVIQYNSLIPKSDEYKLYWFILYTYVRENRISAILFVNGHSLFT